MATRASIAAFRFGYGFRPGETPPDADAMLAGVTRQAAVAAATPSLAAARAANYAALQEAEHDKSMAGVAARKAAVQAIKRQLRADRADRINTAILSPDGFYERLAFFWADHFAIDVTSARAMAAVPAYEADAIRPNLAGTFGSLLHAAVLHPAMLDYLGQSSSVGPDSALGKAKGLGLNENLAREVLKLHTLGVGADYTQADVRQFAELLTGVSIDRSGPAATFRPAWAEPGPETLLGKRYGRPSQARVDAALADLAVHPATARHIAGKLATHFVADSPDPDLVDHLAATFRSSGGDLMAVYGALLDHPASWAPLGAKVRQPFDFVVASLRASGPKDATAVAALTAEADPVAALGAMNQPLWRPPGPNGWPEPAEAWIAAPGLTARVDWASDLGQALAVEVDPRRFVHDALGDVARPQTAAVVAAAAERWEGIALTLASPEFNRR